MAAGLVETTVSQTVAKTGPHLDEQLVEQLVIHSAEKKVAMKDSMRADTTERKMADSTAVQLVNNLVDLMAGRKGAQSAA